MHGCNGAKLARKSWSHERDYCDFKIHKSVLIGKKTVWGRYSWEIKIRKMEIRRRKRGKANRRCFPGIKSRCSIQVYSGMVNLWTTWAPFF